MTTNVLTDTAIRAAIRAAHKAEPPKPIKRYDGDGLYLLIDPRTDSALWRFRYLWQRREKLLSFGKWPEVPLNLARERRLEARQLLAAKADPSAVRKAAAAAGTDSFKAIAIEWMDKQEDWCDAHRSKIATLLQNDVFKFIGAKPIAELTPPELLTVLRRIEVRSTDQALRARQHCSNVFRYAIATARATSDPCRDLAGALSTPPERHYAAITSPKELAQLLRDIDGYHGQPSTAYALKLLPYLLVRPGELRWAEWSEFDLEGTAPEWRIPARRMKMNKEHLVPLAPQVVTLLRELQQINSGRLLFPGLRTGGRAISDNTTNAALRRLGYDKETMTSHGFRSTASSLLNERLECDPDAIELQLAHRGQGVRAIYNRSLRLEQRRVMMCRWADYLDQLRTGGNVVPIRRQA